MFWISIQALVGEVVAAWCCKLSFLLVRSPLRIYITPTQPHSLMLKALFLCLYQKMIWCVIWRVCWCLDKSLTIVCAKSAELGAGMVVGVGRLRRAVSFYLTPWDDVRSTTSLCPPTPHLTSICRGTGFVWGVGGHDWAIALPQCVPPCAQRGGEEQLFWFQMFPVYREN